MSRGRHGGQLGRPSLKVIPLEFRLFRRWSKGMYPRRVRIVAVASEVQMELPLEHLPAYFPDPLRQECFMVRHD